MCLELTSTLPHLFPFSMSHVTCEAHSSPPPYHHHQGPTTTYSLRALPLAGYVSFLPPNHLATATATATATLTPGVRLLDDLSAGRRAVVTVAGVVANVALAAAIVAWQVGRLGWRGGGR